MVTSDNHELAAKRRLLSRLLANETISENRSHQSVESRIGNQSENPENDVESRKKLVRQEYPALRERAYFNFGFQGALHKDVIKIIEQTMFDLQNLGASTAKAQIHSHLEFQLTRQILAKNIGTTPENIALTENATVGCNIILWGLDWQPGDRILLTDSENPTLLIAVESLQRRYNLEVDIIPLATMSDADLLDFLTHHLKRKTKLLVISHVLWDSGRVLPIRQIMELCGDKTRVLVDGAQSMGMIPLSVEDLSIDFYAFGGQKWLCGPEGTGGLYIKPEALRELKTTFAGWRGLSPELSENQLTLHEDARRFEIGSTSTALQAGLRTALKIHDDFADANWRYNHLLKMSSYLWNKLYELSQIGFPVRCLSPTAPASGLVTFEVPGFDPQRLNEFFATQGIILRHIPQTAYLRVCLHYLTTVDEIDELVISLKLFSKSAK